MPKEIPDALLLIAPGCPHCPTVLEGLSRLLKNGMIGRLTVVNIAVHPEAGTEAGTRSVPWTRIGQFELSGAISHAELAQWAEFARDHTGATPYFSHLLETRRLEAVVDRIRQSPETLSDLLRLLALDDTPIIARIGVGAVMEDLDNTAVLHDAVPELAPLTLSEQPQVRGDACHYLALTGNPAAIPYIVPMLNDDNPDVREIAAESLAILREEETAGQGEETEPVTESTTSETNRR